MTWDYGGGDSCSANTRNTTRALGPCFRFSPAVLRRGGISGAPTRQQLMRQAATAPHLTPRTQRLAARCGGAYEPSCVPLATPRKPPARAARPCPRNEQPAASRADAGPGRQPQCLSTAFSTRAV